MQSLPPPSPPAPTEIGWGAGDMRLRAVPALRTTSAIPVACLAVRFCTSH